MGSRGIDCALTLLLSGRLGVCGAQLRGVWGLSTRGDCSKPCSLIINEQISRFGPKVFSAITLPSDAMSLLPAVPHSKFFCLCAKTTHARRRDILLKKTLSSSENSYLYPR
jgi:hypothetical protein